MNVNKFFDALDALLEREGEHLGSYRINEVRIKKWCETFGFATNPNGGRDIFICGKNLCLFEEGDLVRQHVDLEKGDKVFVAWVKKGSQGKPAALICAKEKRKPVQPRWKRYRVLMEQATTKSDPRLRDEGSLSDTAPGERREIYRGTLNQVRSDADLFVDGDEKLRNGDIVTRFFYFQQDVGMGEQEEWIDIDSSVVFGLAAA